MTITLRILIFSTALLFFVFVLHTLKQKKINMKLSLLWFLTSFLLMIASIFSNKVICLSRLLGFQEAANMVFFLGVIVLLVICFCLCLVISKQQKKITVILQEVSLLNKRILDLKQEKEEC